MRNRGIRRKRARRRERYSVDLRPYVHLDEAIELRDARIRATADTLA